MTESFNALTIDGSEIGTSFSSLSTEGIQIAGVTLPPRSDREKGDFSAGMPFSSTGNIQVVIRSQQPEPFTIGGTTAHELFSHARYILLSRLGKANGARHSRQGEAKNEVDRAAEKAEREVESE